MKIQRFIHSDFGKYIISVLLGIGLASFFRKACKERNCVKFVAPRVKEIKGKIFKYNDKCFSFEEKAKTCDASKKMISF
tara:strand:+ start:83 stop:319 length:237 start_codon:yes stop_codon:yes gene_type:complete